MNVISNEYFLNMDKGNQFNGIISPSLNRVWTLYLAPLFLLCRLISFVEETNDLWRGRDGDAYLASSSLMDTQAAAAASAPLPRQLRIQRGRRRPWQWLGPTPPARSDDSSPFFAPLSTLLCFFCRRARRSNSQLLNVE